jgi:hypothetical protein
LQENDCRRDAANPGDDCRCFAGVIHKGFSFPILSKEKPIPYSGSAPGNPNAERIRGMTIGRRAVPCVAMTRL